LTPFYAGLQMEFMANILQKDTTPISTFVKKGNILQDIRKKITVDLKNK
jgi:hypothetical protein